jgi:apolipoprotein N-acyltransferase
MFRFSNTIHFPKIVLCLLSAILLIIAFPHTGGLTFLAFIAWIPLFLLEEKIEGRFQNLKVFLWSYFVFVLFNLGTTWWIAYADTTGAMMAFVCNSFLMALFFLAYHLIHKKLASKWRFVVFAAVWLSFEWFHFRWELSWPWLTLGNYFARTPALVQWYSWTGVLGGSTWIIAMNALLYPLFSSAEGYTKKRMRVVIGTFVLPIAISTGLYFTKNLHGTPFQVTVIQPNIDPYNSKFSQSNEAQLGHILDKVQATIQKQTGLIIAPETALFPNGSMDENTLSRTNEFRTIRDFRLKNNQMDVLIGASTCHLFEHAPNNHTLFRPDYGGFLVFYNTSLLFSRKSEIQIVHKSKLVLGVEKIPFSTLIPAMENLAIQLGGSSGTLGIEPEPKVMQTSNKVRFSPIVCYESIYGEFIAQQTLKNAQFLAIITNDGWWKDTPGYKQHFDFARLRAIENNKWAARSANTGSSGIINNRGDVIYQTGWWKDDSFQAVIQLNSNRTLYQYLGDWIGIVALFATAFFRIWAWKNNWRKSIS